MNYEITEEQIKELAKGNAKVKKMFPEVFETKLEVGKWIKYPQHKNWLLYITEVDKENKIVKGYGFDCNNNWMEDALSDEWTFEELIGFTLATDSEVLEALTNEAKKRGFKEGVCFNIVNGERDPILIGNKERFGFDEYGNKLLMNNWCIFENGKWAEIIKTYTKEEAEKLLNAKII